jgi:1-acyl-sn-glycerol-3-phosphate acyltransferase
VWIVKNSIAILLAVVFSLLTLVTFPFNFKGWVSYYILKVWSNLTLFILGVKVSVFGRENIPRIGGNVYIANHSSYLDILVLTAKVPDKVKMVYKSEMNKIPLLSWAMRAAGYVPIERTNLKSSLRSLERAAVKVKNGISMIIYPEGTRTRTGKIGEFKRGMFLLAEKAGTDIIPLSVTNTAALMPISSMKVKPGIVNIVIGKPMKYSKDKEFSVRAREQVIKNLKPI